MRIPNLGLASLALVTVALNAGQAFADVWNGLKTQYIRGTAVRVTTTVPDGNAQGVIDWWGGRNYYYVQIGGGSVGFQYGLTEGKNVGNYFREFFYCKIDATTGQGEYQRITGTPGAPTEIGLQIHYAGNGNWYGLTPGYCQSPNIAVGVTEFDRAGTYVKAARSRIAVDDTSYKRFWNFNYDDIVAGSNRPAQYSLRESNNLSQSKVDGGLYQYARFGLYAWE